MTRGTYSKVRLDDLMAALGGFEEEVIPARWEQQREHFADLWQQGLPLTVICMRLGRSPGAVMTKRFRFGLPARRPQRKRPSTIMVNASEMFGEDCIAGKKAA